jgi:hypothetical protein
MRSLTEFVSRKWNLAMFLCAVALTAACDASPSTPRPGPPKALSSAANDNSAGEHGGTQQSLSISSAQKEILEKLKTLMEAGQSTATMRFVSAQDFGAVYAVEYPGLGLISTSYIDFGRRCRIIKEIFQDTILVQYEYTSKDIRLIDIPNRIEIHESPGRILDQWSFAGDPNGVLRFIQYQSRDGSTIQVAFSYFRHFESLCPSPYR